MNLYTICFVDNTTFFGGDLINPNWLAIPQDIKIRSVFYALPFGDMIYLSGYDAYYSFIEAVNDLTGENKGKLTPEYIYLIGKKETHNKFYKINFKTGQIEIQILEDNNEWIKKLNPIGWKK